MSSNNGIFDCGKDKAIEGCDGDTIPGPCNTIEDAFNKVWIKSSQEEKDELEGLWRSVLDKTDTQGNLFVVVDTGTLKSICSERNIISKQDHKEISKCDRATNYIKAFTEYDDYKDTIFGKGSSSNCTSPESCGYWNMHTGQKECRFLDQDYGYGYEGDDRTAKDICEAVNKEKDVLVNKFTIGNM